MSQLIFCGVVRFTICLQNFMCFVAQTNFQHLEKFRQNGHHLTTGNNTTIFWKFHKENVFFLKSCYIANTYLPKHLFLYILLFGVGLDHYHVRVLHLMNLYLHISDSIDLKLTHKHWASFNIIGRHQFKYFLSNHDILLNEFLFVVIVRILIYDCTKV